MSLVILLLCTHVFSCLLALCSHPSAPTNGEVNVTGTSIGDIATYTCNVGFELIGNATATCIKDPSSNNASFVNNTASFETPALTCDRKFTYLCTMPYEVYCIYYSLVLIKS